MSTAVADGATVGKTPEAGASVSKKGGKKKLIMIALPVLLIAGGAGLWFSGILPGMLGMNHPATEAPKEAVKAPPFFVDLPEMVANLNTGARRTTFVKLKARLELSKPEDQPAFAAAQPRVIDLFQTYLREMRPRSCAVLPAPTGCVKNSSPARPWPPHRRVSWTCCSRNS